MKSTMFYIAHRGPTIAPVNFPGRWIQHSALFASFKLEKAPFTSGNYLLIDRGPDFEPLIQCGFVGISIMTLDDIEAVRQYGEKYRDFIALMKVDEVETFGGDIDLLTCYGERHVVASGPRTEHALILLRQRKSEISDGAFHVIWMDHLKKVLALLDGAEYPGHVAHTRVTQVATPVVSYSGMTEIWFKSMEGAHACMAAMDNADFAAAESKWTIQERSVTIPTSLVQDNTV
jgi:EthD domain